MHNALNIETHLCPVCGYHLDEPPENHLICSCCGTQFDYDDYKTTHAELRHRWISRGYLWFSTAVQPPAGWNPIDQLEGLATSARPFAARRAPTGAIKIAYEKPSFTPDASESFNSSLRFELALVS
jgi:hypothetical protein